MRITVKRETMTRAMAYHLDWGEDSNPVLESDTDIAEWGQYVVCRLAGYDTEEEADKVSVTVDGEHVIIGGDAEVMETVKTYIL